ncbi:MAG: D-threitol dehydrogenase [Clostridiales bacterium]|jgi:NAD(P)-dependent dehydrogenase (short-subunit alcohol dehydrogenase family)|nr:D-threitol dehydrogenase [Clostridiales bacterium]
MEIAYRENFDINYGLGGKTAIVTGAANGIGEAIARLFARKAANVLLVDLNEGVHAVEREITAQGPGKAASAVADITRRPALQEVVDAALTAFGAVDVLVNCAGVALLEEAESLPEEYWDKTLEVNLKAAFMMSQAVGGHMIKHGGGKIINIASQAAVVALDRHVAYCASKAGLVAVTQVLASEWAEYGINVNAISPTVVLTELGKKAWAGEAGEAMKKLIPAGRFGYPDEIAACAAYLASDAANLITGANLVIDGGFTIR